jgi:hypothetical protein
MNLQFTTGKIERWKKAGMNERTKEGMKERMNKGRGKEKVSKVGWQAEGTGQNTQIVPFNK